MAWKKVWSTAPEGWRLSSPSPCFPLLVGPTHGQQPGSLCPRGLLEQEMPWARREQEQTVPSSLCPTGTQAPIWAVLSALGSPPYLHTLCAREGQLHAAQAPRHPSEFSGDTVVQPCSCPGYFSLITISQNKQ